ncbi:glycosyltransferase family 9 protein [Salinisphaera sp. P385]|uniref:Glycosyltransferase family 9 protein n=1 Tax=Spectribacter acetivorans TaxID=3075603 RepID=A0ABU3B992_9GAMM|nr:glycosyltransferase family 9 protein [Salinisphaera sp. P385]MDT0619042.1 glycosyltransferase family 9 protein [Salinisphaera sp. P385]
MNMATVIGRSLGHGIGLRRRKLPLDAPPATLCLLRLSALGDCYNLVPAIHTMQREWPDTRITWVIGKAEFALLGDLPDIEFIVYDKRDPSRNAKLNRQLGGRRFDVLLHAHPSLRANLVSRHINADLRLGCEALRARDGHAWFVDALSGPASGPHMIEGYFAQLETLGITNRHMDWSVPIPSAAREEARQLLPPGPPTMLINPSASDPGRNWPPERYAEVADYAIARHGLRVALIGGPADNDQQLGKAITGMMQGSALNLIGCTSIKGLLAVLENATLLVTPDSGPAHFANTSGLPVIALHVFSPSSRTGPYGSLQWAVDYHDEAARRFLGKASQDMRWGTQVRHDQAARMIPVDDVLEKVSAILTA